MERKEQQSGLGLSSGFLLGVVVGVIVTLLLTTKRGKKMIKMITEEGMSKMANWEELFTDIADDQKAQFSESKLPSVELSDELDIPEALQVEKKEVSKVKRFFKGIPRHGIN